MLFDDDLPFLFRPYVAESATLPISFGINRLPIGADLMINDKETRGLEEGAAISIILSRAALACKSNILCFLFSPVDSLLKKTI